MAIETEVKVRVDNKKFENLYAKMGAGQFFDQRNLFYALDEGFLRLRLEQEQGCPDRSFLTFKGEKLKSKFNSRKELELFIGKDFETASELLLALGFRMNFEYSKKRINYKSGKCIVSLDILQDNSRYVEIEGSESSIKRNIRDLGLQKYPLEQRSYLQLLNLMPPLELTRHHDCPRGLDLQPGSSNCMKCSDFIQTDWVNAGNEGIYLTKCRHTKKYG